MSWTFYISTLKSVVPEKVEGQMQYRIREDGDCVCDGDVARGDITVGMIIRANLYRFHTINVGGDGHKFPPWDTSDPSRPKPRPFSTRQMLQMLLDGSPVKKDSQCCNTVVAAVLQQPRCRRCGVASVAPAAVQTVRQSVSLCFESSSM